MRYGLQAGGILTATIEDGKVWRFDEPEKVIAEGQVTFGPFECNHDFVARGKVSVVIEPAQPVVLDAPETDGAPVEMFAAAGPAPYKGLKKALKKIQAARDGADD